MSFSTIALACFIKGIVIAILVKFGKWKTHEQRREERQVLVAYREWRKNAGSGPSTDPRIAAKRIPNIDR